MLERRGTPRRGIAQAPIPDTLDIEAKLQTGVPKLHTRIYHLITLRGEIHLLLRGLLSPACVEDVCLSLGWRHASVRV